MLEYHLRMLKDCLSGGDRPNFLYPRFLLNDLKRLVVIGGQPCLFACLFDGGRNNSAREKTYIFVQVVLKYVNLFFYY